MGTHEQTLEQKLRAWLETQGYPLEMRVARAFQEVGANVVQSGYYTDLVTSESREIDVVAYWQAQVERIVVRVNLTIECKTSRDKPWVLFASPRAGLCSNARVVQRAANTLGGLALSNAAAYAPLQDLPLFRLPESPAYAIRQGFNDKDLCYAAIAAVASATAAQAGDPDCQDGAAGRLDFCEIIFPVVVTEARLYSALLDTSGDVELKEQKTGVLLWRNPAVNRPHTVIHIVSTSALTEFSEMASESAERMLVMFKTALKPHLLAARDVRARARALSASGP